MSCDDSFPVFLLYNSGKLTGFGWAMIADLNNPRVEHPTPDEFKVRMYKTVCLINYMEMSYLKA